MLSMFGLLGGLGLLIWLTMRGANLLLAAPACAFLVALSSDIALVPQLAAEAGAPSWTGSYMQGFCGFVSSWFLMFLLGSIFGKVMEDSGAAESVSAWVVARLGMRHAVLAVVIACAILTYGGVSLFVVAFSVYPLALSLFKQANLPRRFIPAALSFRSVTFTMTSAGSPEIALPLLAPHYLGMGVHPEELHRVVAISSGALDSLPHNGYVVTTIRAICGETHKDAYGPVAAMTVIVPALGLALAIGLFLLL